VKTGHGEKAGSVDSVRIKPHALMLKMHPLPSLNTQENHPK